MATNVPSDMVPRLIFYKMSIVQYNFLFQVFGPMYDIILIPNKAPNPQYSSQYGFQ